MSTRLHGLILAIAVVAGLATAPAVAQPKPDKQDRPPVSPVLPASPAAPVAQPIPIPEIADRFEGVTAFLRTLDALLAPRSDVQSVEQGLPALSKRIDERVEATARALAAAPSLTALDSLADSWQPLRLELSAALATLRARALTFEEARDKLRGIEETWTRTRDEARRAKAPEPVLRRIDSVLTSVAEARIRLETTRGGVLVLQDQVAEGASRAEASLTSIGASRGREAGRLFVRESPPVWSPELLAHPWAELPARVRESVRTYRDDIRHFVRGARGSLVAQVLLLAGLSAAFVLARRRVGAWPPTEEGTQSILAMLAHPVAAALVLTLLASPWVHRQQPRAAWTLSQVGTLLPMLLVLRGLVAPPLRPGLYALGGFFLLDLLRSLLVVVPLVEYVLFLLEMLVATALVGWLLISRPGRELVQLYGPTRQLRTFAVLARVALAGFAFALVAAAVGSMSLARLVGAGFLGSAYIGLLLYAGRRLLSAVVMLALRVWPLNELRMVQNHRAVLQRRAVRILRAAAVVFWAGVTLEYFSALRPVLAAGRAVLAAGWTHGTVHISVGDVLAFVLTVWGAFLLSSFVRFVLAEDVFPRMQLDDGVSHAATTLLHYAVLFLGFILAVAALGVDMNRVTVLGGAFGVGLGFGLQNVVSNFISGLIVLFERPIRVGDVVEVGGVAGVVGRIGIRASTIRTWDGSDLIVPNSAFIAERVTNRTPTSHRVAISIPVRVAYGPAPDKAITVLCETAHAQPGVVTSPAPVALLTGFSEGALAFELRAWTSAAQSAQVRSDLAIAVYAALRNAGMEIPLPQQTVRVEVPGPGSARQRGE